MADIKTSKELTSELGKQKRLLDSIDESNRRYEATQRRIVTLQNQIAKARAKENEVARKSQPLYKELEDSIDKQLFKHKDLTTIKGKNNVLTSKAVILQKESVKAQGRLFKAIQGEVDVKGKLDVASKDSLNVLKKVESGNLSIRDLEEEILLSKERQKGIAHWDSQNIKDNEKNIEELLKNEKQRLQFMDAEKAKLGFFDNITGGLVSKAKEFKKVYQENPKVAGWLALGGIVGLLVASATKFAGMIDEIGKEFGSLTVLGGEFQGDLLASSVEAQKLGGGMADVAGITTSLASQFGVNVDEAAKLSDNIFDSSTAMGLSADEGANLFGVLMQTSNLSQGQAEDLAEGAFQLARQAGVAPQAVMKDMAGSTEEIALFTKDGGENIADAAVQARQMGLSLSTTAKVAEGLLDFESSVNKEIEASVLIGRQLNFQKARQLALSGDIAGATKDIVSQLGSEAEFNALNLIQRKALADSVGVSVSELSKMVGQTDKLSLSGALAAGSFDDLAGQEALSNLSSITNQVKSLFTEALVLIGPEIERIVGGFRDWLKSSGGAETIKTVFLSIASTIKTLIRLMPALITAFVAFKTASFALGLATIFPALLKSAAFGGVVGVLATVAAVTAGYAALKATMPVNDFKSGPGGITHMMGPAGAFSLNPRDSVLATTNPIPVNDITSTPAGTQGGGGWQEVVRAITGLDITAGRGVIRVAMEPELGGTPLRG